MNKKKFSPGRFCVPVDRGLKMKESDRINKYLDLARETRKPLNMRVTVILIILGALGTGPKDLENILVELEIRGRVEAI